jgi:hypothetical protein
VRISLGSGRYFEARCSTSSRRNRRAVAVWQLFQQPGPCGHPNRGTSYQQGMVSDNPLTGHDCFRVANVRPERGHRAVTSTGRAMTKCLRSVAEPLLNAGKLFKAYFWDRRFKGAAILSGTVRAFRENTESLAAGHPQLLRRPRQRRSSCSKKVLEARLSRSDKF